MISTKTIDTPWNLQFHVKINQLTLTPVLEEFKPLHFINNKDTQNDDLIL